MTGRKLETAHGLSTQEAAQEDAQEEAQEASEEDALGTTAQEVVVLQSLISFSSDYGPTDEYVGVCHLVIAGIAPDVRVIDLAHGIRGIRAGSFVLSQSVVHAPAGTVHLAIVDPGVGTQRRAVAVETMRSDVLVGPDNGLLPAAAEALGGASSAFELTNPRYRREPVSSTFHGRDLFAPAAAYVATGVGPSELGPRFDPAELEPLPPALCSVADGRLEADVARVDWFGNLQLVATERDLADASLGVAAEVECAAGVFDATVGRTFADAEPSGLVVYVDSGGHVAIACNGESARDLFQDPERVTLKRKT